MADQEAVQTWIAQFGPWGPLVSILLNVTQVLLAPVPGQVVGLANGYLYGVVAGTLYSLIGVVLGSALAMGLGRWFGRPLVVRVVGEENVARWDRITRERGTLFLFLVYLLPLLPDDIVSFTIGLTALSIPRMLVLSSLGRLPGLIVASWIGANAPWLPWWGLVLLTIGAAGLAYGAWRYREEVEQAVLGVIEWVEGEGDM
jgi:uncharacterized membrane protein YdjX (TVP38/TMEM64 family)